MHLEALLLHDLEEARLQLRLRDHSQPGNGVKAEID